MTEKKRQVRNSLIYLIPSIIGGLLPIITLPIFTRILTKEDYGAFALANVYAVLISGIANFGLGVGYERNFFECKNTKTIAGLLYSTLLFVILTSFLGCTVTYLFKSQIAKAIIGSQSCSNLLFFSLCASMVVNVKSYYIVYFKNTENAKALVMYSIDEIFLAFSCSLFMVAYLKIGVIGLALGQFMASSVILIKVFIR
jgi:O-antigen/teichoic acid export membrane protein